MPIKQKILIGGIGASTPVIATLAVVDLAPLLRDLNLYEVIGQLVRVLALFAMGGFVAYLHTDENKPIKLFQLGLAAPALIVSMMNADRINDGGGQGSASPTEPVARAVMFLPMSADPEPYPPDPVLAQADTSIVDTVAKTYAMPKQTKTEQFVEGLLGARPRNSHFVVVAWDSTYAGARQQAEALVMGKKGFVAEIYEPMDENDLYTVVIGSFLTRSEADTLLDKATKAGFPRHIRTRDLLRDEGIK